LRKSAKNAISEGAPRSLARAPAKDAKAKDCGVKFGRKLKPTEHQKRARSYVARVTASRSARSPAATTSAKHHFPAAAEILCSSGLSSGMAVEIFCSAYRR
jgi:hypothetical protein